MSVPVRGAREVLAPDGAAWNADRLSAKALRAGAACPPPVGPLPPPGAPPPLGPMPAAAVVMKVAALPCPRSIVLVGPPLSSRLPRTGSPLTPGHVASGKLRSCAPSAIAPAQLPPASEATIVFASVADGHGPPPQMDDGSSTPPP